MLPIMLTVEELDSQRDGTLRCKICGKGFKAFGKRADRHVLNESRKVTLSLIRFRKRQRRNRV